MANVQGMEAQSFIKISCQRRRKRFITYAFCVALHMQVGMVINETLRIFPPGVGLTRVAAKDIQLKCLFIPKGMIIEFALTSLHQDKEYWGEDVGTFNPERFVSGVVGACTHPQAFMPFGIGPKFCIGNNFALMEAKIVLSMMLRRFHFIPSPNYKHHPTFTMVQKPKYGLPIILKAV